MPTNQPITLLEALAMPPHSAQHGKRFGVFMSNAYGYMYRTCVPCLPSFIEKHPGYTPFMTCNRDLDRHGYCSMCREETYVPRRETLQNLT